MSLASYWPQIVILLIYGWSFINDLKKNGPRDLVASVIAHGSILAVLYAGGFFTPEACQ